MKVLLLTPNFPPEVGGIQSLVYNFCKFSKLKLIVIVPKTEGKLLSPQSRVKIISLKWKKKGKKLAKFGVNFLIWGIVGLFVAKKEKVETIFCSHIVVGYVGLWVSKLLNLPLVIWTHGIEVLGIGKWGRFVLRQSKKIIVTCNFMKKEIRKLDVPEKKIAKIYPGVDISIFHPKSERECKSIEKYKIKWKEYLLTVSRLESSEQYKGHREVIRAMRKIKEIYPKLKYVITGEGSDRYNLEKLVKELNLEETIVFTGEVSGEELVELYSGAKLFVMPSKEKKKEKKLEGFGLVYLEANACKVAVIGGESGGSREAVINGKTGIRVKTDEKEIEKGIIKLLKDNSMRKNLETNGYYYVREERKIEDMVSKIDHLFLVHLR